MGKVRFCLIGCGRISPKHLEAIKNNEHAEMVAICDINSNKLYETAANYDIKHTFTDYELMIKDIKPDAVIICTPSGLHSEMGVFAAENDTHVITEKPMAINLEQADKLIQACETANVHLFVVKQNRLNPTIQLLKKAIDKGRFGRLHSISAIVRWFRNQEYYDQSSWRGTWALDGGAFLNQASHFFDLLSWIGGHVESVMAFTNTLNHKIEVEDIGKGILKFKSGAIGSIEATVNTFPRCWEGSITVMGEKGTVKVGGVAANKIEYWEFVDIDDDDDLVSSVNTEPPNVYGYSHATFLNNVVDVIRGTASPLIYGIEGRKSLEIILSMYESAKIGRMVKI